MAWTIVLAKSVEKQVNKIPPADIQQLLAALEQMREGPFSGDIGYLTGSERTIRRGAGNWRIFFEVDPKSQRVDILEITRRTSPTY